MSTSQTSIDRHPDIVSLHASYQRASESMTAQATFGLILLAGVYAAVSPWTVGFVSAANLMMNDLIIGIVVAVLALGLSSALDRSHGLTWTVPLLGGWLIVAPWVVDSTSVSVGAGLSNVVTGTIVVILGLAAAYFGMQARHITRP